MDQRFRRATFTATMAATITLFSNASWAKKHTHVEPLMKQVFVSVPKSSCPTNLNDEIAKRLIKPNQVKEFLEIISEVTPAYHKAFLHLLDEVDQCIAERRRSDWRDKNYHKLASRLEKAYQDRVRNAINSYAVPQEESKQEILAMLKKCNYLFVESADEAVTKRFKIDDATPKPPKEDPTLWHVVQPEKVIPQKPESETLMDKAFKDIDEKH